MVLIMMDLSESSDLRGNPVTTVKKLFIGRPLFLFVW